MERREIPRPPSLKPMSGHLLPESPITSLSDYVAVGGGEGLEQARRKGSGGTIEEVGEAGLRGRGGAGFPTAIKWKGVADAGPEQRRFVVCNAAEGEPGTFKDRALMRMNPYQILEGVAIGSFAVAADEAYVGIKESYEPEIEALERAATEMAQANLLGEVPIRVVTGPDDYLLGEEKGLMEAIEGRQPLPRWYPPYLLGLHTGTPPGVGAGSSGWDEQVNPTVVNNVETLANVPHILARGSDWFRSLGTEDSPGTMVFTVSGDVRREGVAELPLGTPLSVLVHGVGEGLEAGRRVAGVFPGASLAPIPDRFLDTPMDFGSLEAVGSGLGSGGMIVYDDLSCVVGAAAVLSRFLAVESCGQCPPCKLGTGALTDRLDALENGNGGERLLDELNAWLSRVTDANRCGLGAGERALVSGLMRHFPEVVVEHVRDGCRAERSPRLAKISDWHPQEGRFSYDESYFSWRIA